ncbi:MAG: hypothetical protein A3E87_06690 [Gammaproteobacteria bacterium RIFCSPHIGHO2_12_FULL_35_23]|nr:MAG: hypothetical protein A3E87_06690 [Gammaproteobacteria bacterium RIFCSPHIGHO2_12_FULL_35_23]
MNSLYQELEQLITKLKIDLSVEEMHGLLVGWLCVNGIDEKGWQSMLFPEVETEEELYPIFLQIAKELADPDFGFDLLLPDDEESLVIRGEALALWCQGFLAGIGLTGLDVKKITEIMEPTQDISEISQLDFMVLSDDSKEDEEAFVDISEYVRMAVLLIYAEILIKKSGSYKDLDENIH